MTKFEIVDGVVRGYATAVVELSFDIEVFELPMRESYECEAETPEEFLDLIRDHVQRDVETHIEIALDDLGYRCDDGVNLDSCQTPIISKMELDVEVEEAEEVEDDENE
jgi:hypothetical protein